MPYNRYQLLVNPDGTMENMPKIIISNRQTDKYVVYDPNKTRLDIISANIFNDPTYGWLILFSNPDYSMEQDIPAGTVIRVPFPLSAVLSEYENIIITSKGT